MKPDLSKYQRQISLKSFGLNKQSKLFESKVLIVGLGGLGIPVAQYLNAMGVGSLGLMDRDTIALHNLHRQVLYSEREVGQLKVKIAAEKLKKQNSQTKIIPIPEFLSKENALEIIQAYDLVVDASDNFATRYLINDACVMLKKPFVYGALHDFEGQVSVFNYQDGPTYRCLFPKTPKADEIPNCDDNGVLGILPGIIGNLQALEAVKVLTEVGEVLSGKLLIFDGLTQKNRLVQFERNPETKGVIQLQKNYGFDLCNTLQTIGADDFLHLDIQQQLIDVRSETEFNSGHLEEAMNIPLQKLDDHLDKIALGQPVYLICQSGKRSALAAQRLSELFPDTIVYSIEGGMDQISILCH
ncbi:MAG: HesA/MoeB/ThiF family protein [Bacteroidota bacterium]